MRGTTTLVASSLAEDWGRVGVSPPPSLHDTQAVALARRLRVGVRLPLSGTARQELDLLGDDDLAKLTASTTAVAVVELATHPTFHAHPRALAAVAVEGLRELAPGFDAQPVDALVARPDATDGKQAACLGGVGAEVLQPDGACHPTDKVDRVRWPYLRERLVMVGCAPRGAAGLVMNPLLS